MIAFFNPLSKRRKINSVTHLRKDFNNEKDSKIRYCIQQYFFYYRSPCRLFIYRILIVHSYLKKHERERLIFGPIALSEIGAGLLVHGFFMQNTGICGSNAVLVQFIFSTQGTTDGFYHQTTLRWKSPRILI